MATLVFVHGGWHGAWCWERVEPLLRARGHQTLAFDLAGLGEDRTPPGEVTLGMWTDQTVELVEGVAGGEPVILVGHSRGGIVISPAAERLASRLTGLVYLAAFLLPDGETIGSALPDYGEAPLAGAVRLDADGNTISVDPEQVKSLFYQKTDPAWVERAKSLIRPEPAGAAITPLHLTAANYGSIPRAYIECVEDNAIPLHTQRHMQNLLPCDKVYTLQSDHSPFYSMPEDLADVLDRAVSDLVAVRSNH